MAQASGDDWGGQRATAGKPVIEVCSCGARSSKSLWGCRFCAGLCCPPCTYAPEGLAVCFLCAQDIFGVCVPWLSSRVPESTVLRRHVRAAKEERAAR